jgi:hypothetical protein
MFRQPGVHPYIEDNDLVMIPISEEFITVFRKKSTGKWFSKRYNGLIEPFCDNGDLAIDNKKIILIDQVFGNDATAEAYNMFKPFETVDAGIAEAVAGDLVYVNPAPFDYNVFSNIFDTVGVNFYLSKGVTFNVFSSDSDTFPGLSILGYGDVNFFTSPIIAGTNNSFNLECNNFFLGGAFGLTGSFGGDINIKCNKATLNSFFYYVNSGYWPTSTKPTNFNFNANEVINNSVLFVYYSATLQLNFEVKIYSSMLGVGFADFWCYGYGDPTYPVNCYINFYNAKRDSTFSAYTDPFWRLNFSSPNNKTFITGNYIFIGSGAAVQLPALIAVESYFGIVFFDGVANITKGSMVVDLNSVGIKTETITVGGAGYDSGGSATFFSVPTVTLTGVGGPSLYDVTVTLGVVTGLVLVSSGAGYAVGDTFGFNNVDLGGTGAGAVITVDSLIFAKVVIEGKVYQDNSGVAFNEYLFSTYFISQAILQVKADTISNNPTNNLVRLGQYSGLPTSGGQVSITNCQLVNTDTIGAAPAVIGKGFSNANVPQSWGTLSVLDTKIITTGANSIEGGAAAEPAELVTVYSNKPTLSIANTVPAMPGEFLDAGLTSDDF